ncbi:hypothetical protein LSAT2_023515 [Lamellibrachia satsuma]|nr:hypothetical protein LSAT2_023515 [Lamellibrachia satsuma]
MTGRREPNVSREDGEIQSTIRIVARYGRMTALTSDEVGPHRQTGPHRLTTATYPCNVPRLCTPRCRTGLWPTRLYLVVARPRSSRLQTKTNIAPQALDSPHAVPH